MPASYIYLNDSGSNTWQIGVLDNGTLDPVEVAPSSPAPILLNDADTGTTTWLLTAQLITGVPDSTPATFDPTQPVEITLESFGGFFWVLQIHSDGALFTESGDVPGPLPGLPCGIPGNVTVQGPLQALTIITLDVSATGSPVLLADPLYQYANLDLPFSPNDPGLFYTYQNTNSLVTKTLAARFFDLMDEYSEPVFFDAGSAGASGIQILASECLDVRIFGARGDGVTDDTVAVQAALDKAHSNYLAIQALQGLGPGASGGTIGPTMVCIPSGVICLVGQTPNRYNAGVFGVGYPVLIQSGVTLKVDGQLIQFGSGIPAVINEYEAANGMYGNSTPFPYVLDKITVLCSDPTFTGTVRVYGHGFDGISFQTLTYFEDIVVSGGIGNSTLIFISFLSATFPLLAAGQALTFERTTTFSILATANPGDHEVILGDHDIGFTGVGEIFGSGSEGVAGAGAVGLANVVRVTVDSLTLRSNYFNAVSQTLAGFFGTLTSLDTVISNCQCSIIQEIVSRTTISTVKDLRPGGGCFISEGFAVNISDCTFSNGNGISFISVGNSRSTIVNNHCNGNTVNGITLTTIGAPTPTFQLNGIRVVGNACVQNGITGGGGPTAGSPDSGGNGIHALDSSGIAISTNTCSDNLNSAIHTELCSSCTIVSNGGNGNGVNNVTDSVAFPSISMSLNNPEWDPLQFSQAGITVTIGVPVTGETPGGVVDGTNTAFTLANPPAPPYTLQFFINSVQQTTPAQFTLAGVNITTVTAPPIGAVLLANYIYAAISVS